MSFAATENSNFGGKPIQLYEFQRGATYWRYAASDEDVVVGATTYSHITVTDEGISQSGDAQQDEVKITVPLSLTLFQTYLNGSPSDSLIVRIRRVHDGESEAPVAWVGVLDRIKPINDATVELYCANILAQPSGEGVRLAWTRGCTHMIFDGQCGVDRNSFKRTGTVLSISGSDVVSPGLAGPPAGRLYGGYLEWVTAEGFTERRTIMNDGDGVVTALGGVAGLNVGDTVTAYFGCQRTAEYCDVVFANLSRYGGFESIPGRSPFDGQPVF